jgi:hypothetical protein
MKGAITHEHILAVCEELKNGLGLQDAVAVVGLAKSTFYDYRDKHPEIIDLLKEAEVHFKKRHIKNIQNASEDPKHWQASAWLLERKFKDEFSKMEKVETKTVDDLGTLTDEELQDEIKNIEKQLGKRATNKKT